MNSNKKQSILCKNKRKEWQEEGREKILKYGSDFSFGCALYWGEGDKRKNSVSLCNTDEKMIIFFIKFLKKYFNVKNEELSISINCYRQENLSIQEIENYWLSKLHLNRKNLRKTTIRNKYYNNTNTKHKFGICRIRLHKTETVQQIYGAIKQMSNDNTERWLF